MRKTYLLIIILLFLTGKINAQEINFPPELLWWIYEVKKANPDIEINNFTSSDKEIINFNRYYQRILTYPAFMRWNYSGNLVGYYDYSRTQPRRLPSGRYAICWLTDTVLIGVGIYVNNGKIDLFIIDYRINHTNRTVERTFYTYDDAFDNSDRQFLRLNWYEHRTDYFEIE